MAGIYLHIPFCKQKCAYCDFYSIANTAKREDFVTAICKEIEMQKNYLGQDTIRTIYFGGGTPSLLSPDQIEKILYQIHKHFQVEKNNEITLEANPDDLNETYLKALWELGVNRLSIGIQSFADDDLKRMKRKHTGKEAIACVKMAQDLGFENISIDLIYGLPELNLEKWKNNIQQAFKLNIQHISAYHLSIEPKTLFHKYYQEQKLNLPTEEESIQQFSLLKEISSEKGFLNYEISNFALDGFISLHNTNYWMGVKYLGLGPSAHSYNLSSRQWNIQNLHVYLDAISNGKPAYEIEKLTNNEKYNDFVIISLRTMWGLNIEKLKKDWTDIYHQHFLSKAKKLLSKKLLKKSGNNFILTEKGILISDSIMQDFLYD